MLKTLFKDYLHIGDSFLLPIFFIVKQDTLCFWSAATRDSGVCKLFRYFEKDRGASRMNFSDWKPSKVESLAKAIQVTIDRRNFK